MAHYDTIGRGYAALRRPDPRIAAAIELALGDAASVVNVGAGAGSYEPHGRTVIAVEPSQEMIRQRGPNAARCVQGSAESLPLESDSLDAAMAVLTVHHWVDLERGLQEMARVARQRIVLLTWVPDSPPYWLTQDYFPEIAAHDHTIFPTTSVLTEMLARVAGGGVGGGGGSGGVGGGGGTRARVSVSTLPIPHDCIDGFLCAYWRRPEAYLEPEVRAAMSSFARIDATAGLAKLRADLSSGRWMDCHGHLLSLDALDLGYRIVCAEISSHSARRGPERH